MTDALFPMEWVFWGYFVAVNVAAFALYATDKAKAQRHQWRIPERRLLMISFAGGFVGAGLAMHCCHHKTHKKKFRVCVPLSAAMWIAAAVYLVLR